MKLVCKLELVVLLFSEVVTPTETNPCSSQKFCSINGKEVTSKMTRQTCEAADCCFHEMLKLGSYEMGNCYQKEHVPSPRLFEVNLTDTFSNSGFWRTLFNKNVNLKMEDKIEESLEIELPDIEPDLNEMQSSVKSMLLEDGFPSDFIEDIHQDTMTLMTIQDDEKSATTSNLDEVFNYGVF